MNKFLNVLIFLIIFSLLNFSASSKQENYYYEVQFGNLIVGKAEVLFRSTSQNLNIDIKSQTAGILEVLYEYNGVLKSSSIKKKVLGYQINFLLVEYLIRKSGLQILHGSIIIKL